jgi:hypothetical protein
MQANMYNKMKGKVNVVEMQSKVKIFGRAKMSLLRGKKL